MREGVAPNDGFIGLHVEAGNGRQQFGHLQQAGGFDVVTAGDGVLAGADRHDDFLQRRIAGAFADAVDGGFHLPGAGLDRGQGVGHAHAQVVVVMGGQNHALDARHAVADVGIHADHIGWQRVPHGVRQVDGGGARLDGGFHHAAQEVGVRPRGVLGRPFHVVGMPERQGDGIHRLLDHFLGRQPQLHPHVQLRRRDHDMDAAALGGFQRLGGAQHVHLAGAGQAGDHRGVVALADAFRDGLDAFEIADGGDGEARFKYVHAQFGQGLRHADLLGQVHREARRLLAVAQGGVEDDDAAVVQRAEAGMIDGHGPVRPWDGLHDNSLRGAPSNLPWAKPASNDPARRSGAAKSKKEEAGHTGDRRARRAARGCEGGLAGRVRADGHGPCIRERTADAQGACRPRRQMGVNFA